MSVTTESTGVDQVWRGIERIGRFTGQGIGVAIIDSGVTEVSDLRGRIAVHVDFVSGLGRGRDFYGHGTHIAGIIAGSSSNGLRNRLRGDARTSSAAWRRARI